MFAVAILALLAVVIVYQVNLEHRTRVLFDVGGGGETLGRWTLNYSHHVAAATRLTDLEHRIAALEARLNTAPPDEAP